MSVTSSVNSIAMLAASTMLAPSCVPPGLRSLGATGIHARIGLDDLCDVRARLHPGDVFACAEGPLRIASPCIVITFVPGWSGILIRQMSARRLIQWSCMRASLPIIFIAVPETSVMMSSSNVSSGLRCLGATGIHARIGHDDLCDVRARMHPGEVFACAEGLLNTASP